MNKTAQAKKDLREALRLAKAKGDAFSTSILEQGLVDFDPQPVFVQDICSSCNHSRDPMAGCYCVWGDGE